MNATRGCRREGEGGGGPLCRGKQRYARAEPEKQLPKINSIASFAASQYYWTCPLPCSTIDYSLRFDASGAM